MKSPDVIIRKGELADLGGLIKLHEICFKNDRTLVSKLGKNYIKAYYNWLLSSDRTFILVAAHNNTIVGMTIASDVSYQGPLLRNTLKAAISAMIIRPWLIFHPDMIRRFFDIIFFYKGIGKKTKIEPEVAFWVSLGISPECRGIGLGARLTFTMMQECYSRGARSIRGGFHKGNTSSRRVFEKCGFKVVPELETKSLIFMQAELKGNYQLEI